MHSTLRESKMTKCSVPICTGLIQGFTVVSSISWAFEFMNYCYKCSGRTYVLGYVYYLDLIVKDLYFLCKIIKFERFYGWIPTLNDNC